MGIKCGVILVAKRSPEGCIVMLKNEDSLEARVSTLEKRFPKRLDLITARTTAEFEEAFEKIINKAIQNLEKTARISSHCRKMALLLSLLECLISQKA